MVTLARFLLVAILSMMGLGALGQELVIFTDNRSLQVQSHRVDGTWTYLRIGSGGEMAVPSASILRVDNERGVTAAATLAPSNTPSQSQATPPSQQSSSGPEAVRRPNLPPPVAAVPEDEEDEGADTEMDEPEPPEPPAKAPDVPGQNPGMPQNPGLMQTPQGMPPRPGVFPQNQPPGTQPQKPVDED